MKHRFSLMATFFQIAWVPFVPSRCSFFFPLFFLWLITLSRIWQGSADSSRAKSLQLEYCKALEKEQLERVDIHWQSQVQKCLTCLAIAKIACYRSVVGRRRFPYYKIRVWVWKQNFGNWIGTFDKCQDIPRIASVEIRRTFVFIEIKVKIRSPRLLHELAIGLRICPKRCFTLQTGLVSDIVMPLPLQKKFEWLATVIFTVKSVHQIVPEIQTSIHWSSSTVANFG